jgi:hypothetical protein
MKRNKKHILFLFLIVCCFGFIAGDTLRPLFTIRSKADFFTTDNFGNTYLVKADEIRKYNPSGDLLKIYSNKNLGKITSVDATNPLRLLIFYKDFASVIILDDLLSQNGDIINLLDLSLEQSDLVCTAFNNGMWFYNRQNANLIRLDDNLQTAVNTGNLNRLLGIELKPNFMLEYAGYVYINNPAEGVLVFDIYGTYFKTIPIKGLTHFQVKEDLLIYFSEGSIRSYDLKKLTAAEMAFPGTSDVRVEKENYFLFYKDSVLVKSTAD